MDTYGQFKDSLPAHALVKLNLCIFRKLSAVPHKAFGFAFNAFPNCNTFCLVCTQLELLMSTPAFHVNQIVDRVFAALGIAYQFLAQVCMVVTVPLFSLLAECHGSTSK
jgi:hypothetical protein